MNRNPVTNGFQFTECYVSGPGGEEFSKLNGSGTWPRTNVYGGGKLIGTYDLVHNPAYMPGGLQPQLLPWLHLHLEDALGTRHMQVSGMLANLAQPEMDFESLPYGNGFSQFRDQQFKIDRSQIIDRSTGSPCMMSNSHASKSLAKDSQHCSISSVP